MKRKTPLTTGQVYHVMNKSIAGYGIFPRPGDYERMIQLIRYFNLSHPPTKFSEFRKRSSVEQKGFAASVAEIDQEEKHQTGIIAFCLMPTHIHLAVKQLEPNGVSRFLSLVLNGYARYFNTKYQRRGPLFVGPFKNVLVEGDEQLVHLTRYIHLNPVTADIIDQPEKWPYSSYREYIQKDKIEHPLCKTEGLIDMNPQQYQSFVNDHSAYQRELALIKHQIME